MANKITPPNDVGTYVITLDTTGAVQLPAPDDKAVSSWRLQVIHNGASPGTFVIKTALFGSGLAIADAISPIYYKDTSATAVTAATAVSTEDIFTVLADQCVVFLDFTAVTHSVTVYARPQIG